MSLKDLIKEVRKETKFSVVREINRIVTLRARRPSSRKNTVWHPSEIVGDGHCPRYEVLSRRVRIPAPQKEVDVELERIFDVGHALHFWYQEKYLGPAGILYGNWRCSRCHTVHQGLMPADSCDVCQWGATEDKEGPDLTSEACTSRCGPTQEIEPEADARGRLAQEVGRRGGCTHCGIWGRWEFREMPVVIPEHNIEGMADGLLVDETGTPNVVCDIKTTNERRFGYLQVTGPSAQNIKQIMLYMHGLKKKRGCVLYVSKNDGRIAEFFFNYDRSLIEDELSDTLLLEKCLADEEHPLPERHEDCATPLAKKAKGCAACDACFAEND